MNFQLLDLSTIIILKTMNGDIIKISKDVPSSFLNMSLLVDGTYYDSSNNTYWHKNTSKVSTTESEFYQEEYINVTKYLEENRKLSQLLKEDPLTKIANIKAVVEKQKEIELNKKNCIIVMCDINDFKLVNDTYGHSVGDKILIEISSLFKNEVCSEQNFVARIGGDEFIFLFVTSNTNLIMEKMKDLQEKVIQLGNKFGLSLSISIGISNFKYGDVWEEKKNEADCALYYAKNSGDKNNLAYYNSDIEDYELYRPINNDLKLKIGVKK